MSQITIPALRRILKNVPRSSVEGTPKIYTDDGNTYVLCKTPNYANRIVEALRLNGVSCNLNYRNWQEVVIP